MPRLALLIAFLIAGSAATAIADEIPIDHQTYPVPRSHRVHLDFPVGDLTVEPGSGNQVEFDLRARCHDGNEDCEDRASRVRLNSDHAGGTLDLSIKGYPHGCAHLSLIGVLRVPRDHGLTIEMGVGSLDVSGVAGDLDVSLGVGEARVSTAERETGPVSVSTGVGDADVRTASGRVRHQGFIGSAASWDGSGRSSVTVHVGVGEAKVRVD